MFFPVVELQCSYHLITVTRLGALVLTVASWAAELLCKTRTCQDTHTESWNKPQRSSCWSFREKLLHTCINHILRKWHHLLVLLWLQMQPLKDAAPEFGLSFGHFLLDCAAVNWSSSARRVLVLPDDVKLANTCGLQTRLWEMEEPQLTFTCCSRTYGILSEYLCQCPITSSTL